MDTQNSDSIEHSVQDSIEHLWRILSVEDSVEHSVEDTMMNL